jgi:DNA replication protein DnaC
MQAISKLFSQAEREERNGYLAAEVMHMGIDAKNRSTPCLLLPSAPRLLQAVHFGVEQEVAEEREEAKAAVRREVGKLIGMENVKKMLQQLESQAAYAASTGQEQQMRELSYNTIITGNPGTGKTTVLLYTHTAIQVPARLLYYYILIHYCNPGTGKTSVARLLQKFLFAHGVLQRYSLLIAYYTLY